MRIIQKKWSKPTQDISLTDDDFVTITYKRLLSENTFKLDLRKISPEPSRQKSFRRKPLGIGIIFGLLTLINLVSGVLEKDPVLRPAHFQTVLVWFLLMLITAIYGWPTRIDIYAYFNHHTGNPILTLYVDNPDPATFQSFTMELNARLQKVHPRYLQTDDPPNQSSPFSLN